MDLSSSAGEASPTSSAESSFRELDDVFLQNQARIWIGEVLQARLDEQQNVSDLLADGELLFEVSKIIWKKLGKPCVDIKHDKEHRCKPVSLRKSSGRYSPYSNVDSFLKVCKIVGLASFDLFSPSDLVEKKDTRRVCMCIRSLSKKARSEELNVPDFDIVTYTVAMPTDMVGCLRRSLELSQCSSLTSASDDGHKDSTVKCKQKFPIGFSRNIDPLSDDSGEPESNSMIAQSPIRLSNFCSYADDSVVSASSDLENSPVVSSEIKSYKFATSGPQSDFRTEGEEYVEEQCGSQYSDTSVGPLFTRYAENKSPLPIESEIQLRDRFSRIYSTPKSTYSALQLPMTNLIGYQTSSNDDTLSHDDTLSLDVEDSILYMRSESDGSNSIDRTSNNIEDDERSSTVTTCSVSSRVQYLDFESQCNLESDYGTSKAPFPESQSDMADLMSKAAIDEISVHNLRAYNVKPQFEISGLHWNSCAGSFTDLNDICYYQIGSGVENDGIHDPEPSADFEFGEESPETFLHCVLDNASGSLPWSKNVEFNTNINVYPDDCSEEACLNDIVEVPNKNFEASLSSVKEKESEECDGPNSLNDLYLVIPHENGTSEGNNDHTVHGLVIPSSSSKHAPEKTHRSTIECGENVDELVHEVSEELNMEDLHSAQDAQRMNHEDERKRESLESSPVDSLNERGNTGVGTRKSPAKTLLKLAMSSTAILGALFIFDQFRKGNGMKSKDGAMEQPGQDRKTNTSSQRRQKEGKVNGVYPSGKL